MATNGIQTVRGTIEEALVNHGLRPDEAKAVVDRFAKSPGCEAVKWGDPAEAHPKELLAVLWISAKSIAIEYLKETKPTHFALGVLATSTAPCPSA